MLLFKPYHIKSIQDKIKTQTRRIWKKPRCKVGSIHKAKTKMLSKEYYAKLSIVDIHKEHLLDISEEDAYHEGGYTREEFLKMWDEINPGYPSVLNPLVYVVTFNPIVKSFRRL